MEKKSIGEDQFHKGSEKISSKNLLFSILRKVEDFLSIYFNV